MNSCDELNQSENAERPPHARSNWSPRLPEDCSIAAIRGVYDLIRGELSRCDSLEIDCSDVAKADVTSIQLPLSTAKTGEAQGRPVVLTAFSQSFRNTLRRAGFLGESITDHPVCG